MCRKPARKGAKQTIVTAGQEGAVLLLVMWIIALIGVLVMGWAQEWRMELRLAANFRDTRQCRRLAEGGVYYALGRMVESIQAASVPDFQRLSEPANVNLWQGDQGPHILEVPGGKVEVRVADEGGKVNINFAGEGTLTAIFTSLGYDATKVRTMVDSLLDWRSREGPARPFGAQGNYYLGLDPPYPAKNGRFEVVEELAWVRGFENGVNLARLADLLTAQQTTGGVNINTAPAQVLLALGVPPEVASNIILTRQASPFRSLQDVPQLGSSPLMLQPVAPGEMRPNFMFVNSPFFTIKSTGMLNKKKVKYTVKAIARVDISMDPPWEILGWYDDYPG